MATKEAITQQAAKKKVIESVYKSLVKQLADNGHAGRETMFTMQDNSIFIDLPADFFQLYTFPEGTRIEMKFTVKR